MKCKICGYDIVDGQEICSGCETPIEDLKNAGNIEYEYVEKTEVAHQESEQSEMQVDESANIEEPISEPVKESPVGPESIVSSEPIIMDEFKEEPIQEEVVGEVTPIITPIEEPVVEEVPVVDNSAIETPVVEEVTQTEITPVVEEPATSEVTPEVEIPTPVVESTPVESVENLIPVVDNNQSEQTISLDEQIPAAVPTQAPEEDKKEKKKNEKIKKEKVKKEKDPNKKSKVGLIIIIIVAIIVALLGVVGYFYFIVGNPSNIFSKTVNGINTSIGSKIDEYKKNNTMTLKLIFINSGKEELNNLAKSKITLMSNIDSNSGNSDLHLGVTYFEERLDADFILSGKELYVLSNNINEKSIMYNIDNTKYNTYFEDYKSILTHTNEMKDVVSILSNYLLSNSKDYNFKKSITKKVIDDKDKTVYQTSLIITKEQASEILNSIKSDEKLIQDLVLINNSKVEEEKANLTKLISNIKIDEIKITIFTDILSPDFYGADIIIKNGEEISTIKIEKTKSNYIFKTNIPNKLDLVINTNTRKMIITTKDNTDVLTINVDYNISHPDNLSIKEVADFIVYDELTEEEKTEINNKINDISFIKELKNTILKESNNKNTDNNTSSDIIVDDKQEEKNV